jgi:hypothetical protein
MLEARVGIEPTHKGFADLSLTTWVPRLDSSTVACSAPEIQRQSLPIRDEPEGGVSFQYKVSLGRMAC